MNKPESFAGNLFPISKPSAETAFGIFDNNFERSRREGLLSIGNTTTSKLWTRFIRGLAQVLPKNKQVNPTEISRADSFLWASKTFQENDPTLYDFLQRQEEALWRVWQTHVSLSAEEAAEIERRNRRSYRYGIITGYTALLHEAELRRYGVLPTVPEDVLRTWRHDNIERTERDLELFIDVVSSSGPEGMLDSVKSLDKLNPYVSGYVGAFFRQEEALNEAFMKHFGQNTKVTDSVNNIFLIGITPGKVARGIYDVCSVWQATYESRKLQASFG